MSVSSLVCAPAGSTRARMTSKPVASASARRMRASFWWTVEVAYRLACSAWGRGIATEAAGALVNHALGALALPRVVAVTYPDNVASQRVLCKLGFEPRGLTEYKGVQATWHVLTREAWRART